MGGMYIFDIQNGNSMNMPMLMVSAFAVSKAFINDNHRAFHKSEKRFLSIICTLIAFAASIFVYILVILLDPNMLVEEILTLIKSLPIAVWVIIVFIVALIYYFILGFFYGWVTNKIFAKQISEQM
tara:strand:+ start:3253 stop:3630 length:378 start_codon:yes stop_codon:yes gene_type:complete